MNNDKNNQTTETNLGKPDPETLHTTDPQEKMKGPFSSAMHEAGEPFDSGGTKEEADEEKEKNM